jgi:hypothetical protein
MSDKRRHLYDGDLVTVHGYAFRVRFEHDDQAGEPWKECDGHGIVSDWTSREKRPGERVLAQDRSHKRYYDIEATIKLATQNGWGPHELREGETPGQRTARAVDEDFEYLRQWCADEWEYLCVSVTYDEDDEVRTSLFGVESYRDYHNDVAYELIGELLSEIEVETPDAVLSEN